MSSEDRLIPFSTDLSETESLYQDLYENAPDMYLSVDSSGIIVHCNETSCRVLGYGKNEIEGRQIFDFMTDACRISCQACLAKVFKEGKVEVEEVELYTRGGEKLTFHVNATAILDADGKPTMTRGVWRDVTVKKKLEQQLIQSQKMESLGTLAGGIAHDFNNILGGILGYASYIREHPRVDDELLPFLDIIEKSARRAAALSNRILTFSRGSETERRPIELSSLIDETCMLMEKRIEKNVTVIKNFQRQSVCTLGVDHQLQQVFMNLFLNACDAMPDGGKLRVDQRLVNLGSGSKRTALSPGEYAEVTVSDTGSGIPPEVENKIFDPFFTTKEPGRGTGLGLAMVYGIVKSHQGHIEVSSMVGQGSAFRVLLPTCPGGPAPTGISHAPIEEAVSDQAGRTALVVDDEEVIRNLARHILTREGFQVLVAESGPEACRIFEEKKCGIDVVILDMIMPGMTGKETYEQIRTLAPDVKVIFSTGYSQDEPCLKIPGQSKTGFLQKPYNIEGLINEVTRVLGL